MKSHMAGFERDVLNAVWNSKRVWLLHVIANAVLFTAFFYWLRISDESAGWFAVTVLVGAMVLLCTLWLHAATLDYFHRVHTQSSSSVADAMRAAIARVPAFLAWTIVLAVVLDLIGSAWDYDAQVGGWARHMLPGFLRQMSSPRGMTAAFVALVWFLFYFLWPIIFLPVGAQVASYNFRGFFGRKLLDAFRPLRELRFWGVYVVCFVLGMYLPYLLVNMDPKQGGSLHYQTASMVGRLGIAYLLLVTGWLLVCSAIARVMKDSPETDAVAVAAQPVVPVAS